MSNEVVLATANMRVLHDKDKNLGRIIRVVEEAARRDANLLVLPEVALQGYCWNITDDLDVKQKKYYDESAEPIPGPSTDILTDYARRHQIYIQLGIAEKARGGGLYNSVALIGPKGVEGTFRKVHNKFERAFFGSGNSMPVWRTPLGVLGPIICYDLCFPEAIRIHALHGASIITMSTAWALKGEDPSNDYYGYIYDLLAKANSLMNQVWLIQANFTGSAEGRKPETTYYGHSRIISPLGYVVEEAEMEEKLITVRVDVQKSIREARAEAFYDHNFLKDRRPELYLAMVDKELHEKGKM